LLHPLPFLGLLLLLLLLLLIVAPSFDTQLAPLPRVIFKLFAASARRYE
jgi:hypothetical protein